MTTKNDTRIIQLKQKIEERREELKVSRFSPRTSCNILLYGERYNLHVANKETLVFLLCHLSALEDAAEKTGYADSLIISGYKVKEWIDDIQERLEIQHQRAELEQLKAIEAKLDGMLSDNKKVELELDSIAGLLG